MPWSDSNSTWSSPRYFIDVSKVSRNSRAVGFGITLVWTISFSRGNCFSTGPSCISDEP
jgi:hypothetical protein